MTTAWLIAGRQAEIGPAYLARIVSRRPGSRGSRVAEQPQHAALADLQSLVEVFGIGTGLGHLHRVCCIMPGRRLAAGEMDGGLVGRIGSADRGVLAADLQ